MGGGIFAPARLLDISAGGLLLELRHSVTPPALGTMVTIRLRREPSLIEQRGRVVRVRWRGRDRGALLPSAIAVVFVPERGAPAP